MVKSSSRFLSPLRYPGGKGCIFPFVADLILKNNLRGISYAEPYAGGAGLALRLLTEEYVDSININDFDCSIYSFWHAALNNHDDFCAWIQDVEVSMETWHACKQIQREAETHSIFEIGTSTFFLNRTNISGVVKGGVIGGQKQLGKYKIDARFDKEDLISRIQRIALFKKRIHLSNLDGKEFIKRLNKKRDACLIYLDPPYYKKGSNLYMNYFKKEDHERLRRVVGNLNKYWFVSYDFCDFISQLYNGFSQVKYQLSQCTSNRTGEELLIFDKKLHFQDSINTLTAPSIV